MRPQSTQNNQGRAPVTNEIQSRHAQQSMRFAGEAAYDAYDSLLHVHQVSREISRGVLPLHTYTELYWKCDLHNFFHFLKLRLDAHAQYEIRVLVEAMYAAVTPHFPLSCEASMTIYYTRTPFPNSIWSCCRGCCAERRSLLQMHKLSVRVNENIRNLWRSYRNFARLKGEVLCLLLLIPPFFLHQIPLIFMILRGRRLGISPISAPIRVVYLKMMSQARLKNGDRRLNA